MVEGDGGRSGGCGGGHIWSCLLPLMATTIGFHSSTDCQVKYSVGSLVNADLTRRGPLSGCVSVCVEGVGGLEVGVVDVGEGVKLPPSQQ